MLDTSNRAYKMEMDPEADQRAVVAGESYRFTVLTPKLIRMEYSEGGVFEDLATQTVINRNFPLTKFRIIEETEQLEIITEYLHLVYNKKPFSRNGLSVQVKGNLSAYRSIWRYGEKAENLMGTARTLDESNGAIALEEGLLSRNGFAVIDDSRSILINRDGWVAPRSREAEDLYFFGYGREYLECLKDFYHLCGHTPMLPRYALGNWWSRFYRYTEEEYKELVERFDREKIPFSVAVLDMDWHLTEIDKKYGSGWTGYTWNREFFPDPERFLAWLHGKGMHVTLNVHPADGVRAHEEMYLPMARELGINYEQEDQIRFDISDPQFLDAYFKYLHHPNERIGVDFWWVDWQQGGSTSVEGLDPLWMLNHYHFLDNGRDGKRPMTFSRYAGLGSHRYPVGFSGDTFATWDTLDFQPYFTATASNAGYGWWSHDIGGHMHGVKNDEMLVRWIQFGVFSPIMRIHSSSNPFFVKEPWKFNSLIEAVLKKYLSLRHQLVPYLYTMNRLCHEQGEPLIQPMYYHNPEAEEAYHVPNQYYFGTGLIVCPITGPADRELGLGVFKGWLPEGIYYDFFDGRVYRGGRRVDFYRDIIDIPVLARAGAIIPLVRKEAVKNSTDNPVDLEVRIYAGADGEFSLYEDESPDNTGQNLHWMNLDFTFQWGSSFRVKVVRRDGEAGIAGPGEYKRFQSIPDRRNYHFIFTGVADTGKIRVRAGEDSLEYEKKYHNKGRRLELFISDADTRQELLIEAECSGNIAGNDILPQVFDRLDRAQIAYDLKDLIYQIVRKHHSREQMLAELQTLNLESNLLGALYEIITAY